MEDAAGRSMSGRRTQSRPGRKRARRHDPPSAAGAGAVRTWVSRPGAPACATVAPPDISEAILEPGTLLWVDVRDPGEAELQMLREEFRFHHLALEDVTRQRQRPKVDDYPGHYFVVLYAPVPGADGGTPEAVELDLFVGRNYVVTLHRGEIPALQDAAARWEKTAPELRSEIGILLHTICDSVIDGYFPLVDEIEDRLDELELSLFQPGLRFDPGELLGVKRRLFEIRKVIYPLREVFNTFLRRDSPMFTAATYPYFQDSYDHVLRLLDIVDVQREIATGTLEAHLSLVSNNLNETMKRLTVVAVCVALLGAIFGAWGMNFDAVPLHEYGVAGFAGLCSVTLTLVALVLAVSRRLGFW